MRELIYRMADYDGTDELENYDEFLSHWIREKANMAALLVEGKKIGDFGCGTGQHALHLKEKGFEVTGFEPDERLVTRAREKGVDVVHSTIEGAPPRYQKSFDSGILFDVLEHCPDEQSTLESAGKLLRPNGVLLVSVPAFSFLFSSFDHRVGHYRRYSKRRLRDALTSAGYLPEHIRYWNSPGFFGWLLYMRLLGRSPSQIKSKTVNSLYGTWLPIENRIPNPLFGLSIVAKARLC